MKVIVISIKLLILEFLHKFGTLVKYITYPIPKKHIVFFSKKKNLPDQNHIDFRNYVEKLIHKKNRNMEVVYINRTNTFKEKISVISYLISAKLFIYNIPSDLYIFRILFARNAKKILIHKGIAIKSGGNFSKHLNLIQKKFYNKLCKDVDFFIVSSQLEKYITISSLDVPFKKVKIVKKEVAYTNRELANLEIHALKKQYDFIVSYFPTHRDHTFIDQPTLFKFLDKEVITILKRKKILLLYSLHNLDNSDVTKFSDTNIQPIKNFITNPSDAFNLFDSLITDYSGIYLKLLLDFEVSLAFVFSDIEEYIKKRGIILPKDFLFPGSYINNKDDLIFYLENLDKYDKDRYSSSRKNLHSIFYSSDIYDNLENLLK